MAKWWNGRHATLRTSCHSWRGSSPRLPGNAAPWLLLMRVSQAQPGLISLDRRVRLPDPLLTLTRYANRQSGEVESLVFVGSSPTLVTHDPVIQRLRRLDDTQEADGSTPSGITRWSAGVSEARVFGKDEDRVRFPGGPLELMGWHVPRRRLTFAKSVRRVRFPSGPLKARAHGQTARRQLGRLEIWVRFPVGPLKRKVAGNGLSGRTANAEPLRAACGFESHAFRSR